MNNKLKWSYFILILILNSSCVENESSKKEVNQPELASTSVVDTLTFTSGVRSILHDSKGRYWFGSHQEGLSLYDGNAYQYFTTEDGLSDNQVRTIQEDEKGNIWIATAQGVHRYDGETITNHTSEIDGNAQSDWKKEDKDLWFTGGNHAGVYRYDGQNMHFLAFPSHKTLNLYDNLYAVTSLAKGKNNMIWIGTYAGVFGYNGSDFTIINDNTLGLDRNIEPLHLRSILEDSKGRLWLGNNGIGVLLKEGNSTINFSEKNKLIYPIGGRKGDKSPPGTLEHVFEITEDSQGNIWFGDRDTGAWQYDGESMTNYAVDTTLKSPMIWAIYEDQNKNLLFGMAGGGVYQFNGKTFDRRF